MEPVGLPSEDNSFFYDKTELSILLKIPKKTISNWLYVAPENLPPSVKIGNRRLWKKAVVHAWLDDLKEAA